MPRMRATSAGKIKNFGHKIYLHLYSASLKDNMRIDGI